MNTTTESSGKSMLVLRFSALGDVAMTIPAVYSLARQYPELRIHVATTPFFARLFINAPANVEIHAFDIHRDYAGARGLWRLYKALKALNPTYVADLHNVLRTWTLGHMLSLAGARLEMVDKMRSGRRDVLRRGRTQPNFVNRYATVFANLGYPVSLDFKSLFARTPEPPIEITHPAAGIAPFARYFNKTYPLDRMRRVVELLTARGVNVYLFGARGREAEQLGSWAPLNKLCHSVAGRFTIEQELALMANMDVMVSMDSANQHMASLADVPVVSVWGSTTPACGFMGYGQKADNAVVAGLECQPCSIAGKPECPLGHLDCFGAIAPEKIVEKVMTVLNL